MDTQRLSADIRVSKRAAVLNTLPYLRELAPKKFKFGLSDKIIEPDAHRPAGERSLIRMEVTSIRGIELDSPVEVCMRYKDLVPDENSDSASIMSRIVYRIKLSIRHFFADLCLYRFAQKLIRPEQRPEPVQSPRIKSVFVLRQPHRTGFRRGVARYANTVFAH